MNVEILIPIAFFIFLGAIILVPGYLKSRERQRLHETLRAAYEKGQPVPPEMIEALMAEKAKPAPERDLRRGIVLMAIAAAMVTLGAAINQVHDHALWPLIGAASFPGFVGFGYLAFWLTNRKRA